MTERPFAWIGPWRPTKNHRGLIIGFGRHYAMGSLLGWRWVLVPGGETGGGNDRFPQKLGPLDQFTYLAVETNIPPEIVMARFQEQIRANSEPHHRGLVHRIRRR